MSDTHALQCVGEMANWIEPLYGRDVPRLKDFCPVKRKKKEYRWTKPRELRGKRGRSNHRQGRYVDWVSSRNPMRRRYFQHHSE